MAIDTEFRSGVSVFQMLNYWARKSLCLFAFKRTKALKITMTGAIFFFILCSFISAPGAAPAKENKNEISCPPDTLFSPIFGVRALIGYASGVAPEGLTTTMHIIPPNLMEPRKTKGAGQIYPSSGMPVPGGIGAGIGYANGYLQVLQHAELHTLMYVYPNGVNPSGPLTWLFTTATNRTEKTVEFVAIYTDSGGRDLGVFDWSCSAVYSCANGQTGASWQWTKPISDFACNMTQQVDAGGHIQTIVYYDNMSAKLDAGSPPLWENAVFLWNYCNSAWDLVYSHQFRADQKDCSIDGSCGWWGPILETFDDPEPQINEVGFEGTWLLHDGTWSSLSTNEAYFVEPVSPWLLFHLDPDRGFGAGNYVALRNLRPYVPSGWSDSVVVSNTTGTNTDTNLLYAVDNLYVDWAVTNEGNLDAEAFNVDLYVDNSLKATWPISSLAAGGMSPLVDYGIGQMTTGSHTISIVIDAKNTIVETNENDNSYTKSLYINEPDSCIYAFAYPYDLNTSTWGPWSNSIQSAYNQAQDGYAIYARILGTNEHVIFDKNISVKLRGGCTCEYASYGAGWTSIYGSLTISHGTVEIQNIMIQ